VKRLMVRMRANPVSTVPPPTITAPGSGELDPLVAPNAVPHLISAQASRFSTVPRMAAKPGARAPLISGRKHDRA
jgi:hypothetical protein